MPQVDIKITSLADLRGFIDTVNATKQVKKETESLGAFLKQGLGIGGGIELARRGIELFKESVGEAVRGSFDLAGQVKDGAESLNISRQAYQVLGEVMKEAGGSQERMTQAIAANNRSLLEARSLVGPAAAAYRTLGLDPVELEGLSVERRLEYIGKAVDGAKDKTEAFSAAGDILGSKNLPTLLNALRQLGTDGYDTLAAQAEKAGRIMSDDTVERLDKAEKAIAKFKQSITIQVGESIAAGDALKDSFSKDFGGTFLASLKALVTGNVGDLAMQVAMTLPSEPNKAEEKARADAKLAANAAIAKSETDLLNVRLTAEGELTQAKLDQQRVDSENTAGVLLKGSLTIQNLEKEYAARQKIIEVLKLTKLGDKDTPQSRATAIAKLESEQGINQQTRNTIENPRSAADTIRERAGGTEDARINQNFIAPGQGVATGLEQYVTQIGSLGEQVADSIRTSVGSAVDGISTGIYQWVIGAQGFGAALRNIGQSILQTMLRTLVQMGAQFVINAIIAKAAMWGISAVSDSVRAGDVAKTNAANAAKLPLQTAGAAASGISSFGVALAFGAIAVGLILALSGGFADGGFTGGNSRTKPAGIVHEGEWVAPQWMVDSPIFGGVIAGLEGARNGAAAFLEGGMVDPGNVSFALARPMFQPAGGGSDDEDGGSGRGGPRPINVHAYYDMDALKKGVRDSDGENFIIDVLNKNGFRSRY